MFNFIRRDGAKQEKAYIDAYEKSVLYGGASLNNSELKTLNKRKLNHYKGNIYEFKIPHHLQLMLDNEVFNSSIILNRVKSDKLFVHSPDRKKGKYIFSVNTGESLVTTKIKRESNLTLEDYIIQLAKGFAATLDARILSSKFNSYNFENFGYQLSSLAFDRKIKMIWVKSRLNAQVLFDFVKDYPEEYNHFAKWYMNEFTLEHILKFPAEDRLKLFGEKADKESDIHSLRMLNYDIVLSEQMDNLYDGLCQPIVLGNFWDGYSIEIDDAPSIRYNRDREFEKGVKTDDTPRLLLQNYVTGKVVEPAAFKIIRI